MLECLRYSEMIGLEMIVKSKPREIINKMLKVPNYVYGAKTLDVPAHLNFSTYILDRMWQYKDNIALINGTTHETMKYGEIVQQAVNFAVSLHRMGVRKGDVIGILAENRQEYWGAVFGATSTGAIITTFSTGYVKGELTHAMNISKPKYVICSPSGYEAHKATINSFKHIKQVILFGDNVPRDVISYNDLAVNIANVDYEQFEAADVNGQIDTLYIVYSSGTTGLAKGVMLTHLNAIITCCSPLKIDPDAMTFTINPWYHVMGLISFSNRLSRGTPNVYMPRFHLDTYLKAIERYKVVQLILAPPVLVAVCKSTAQYDLSSVTLIYSGAAPLHKDSWRSVYDKFPRLLDLLQGYGASECTLAITQFNYDDVAFARKKPGSVGKAAMGCTLKVVDTETRKPLGPNQLGEICVKGPLLMKGYIGVKPGDDFDNEGFYKTGDMGYFDEDNCFYIVDRLKELIKYKGFQVPPAELEALLLTHEAVKDVGVIGIPHEAGGEVPLAFVVAHGEVSEAELQKFVAERVSNPKHLRGGVRFVPAIPKSLSGKILRKDLKKMVNTGKSKL